MIFEKYPAFQGNLEKNILLSYCIQGAYHAYVNHPDADVAVLVDVIGNISRTLGPLFRD